MKARRKSQSPPWIVQDERPWNHFRVDVSLLADPRIGVYELGVYAGLAAHAELATGESRPSKETLAGYLGASERKVYDAIKVLAACRYIRVIHRPGSASVYVLLPPPEIHALTRPRTPAPHAGVSDEPPSDPGTTCQTTPAPHADELVPLNENEEEEQRDDSDPVPPPLADQLVDEIADRALACRIAERPNEPVNIPGRWLERARGRIARSDRMRLAAQAVRHPALGCAGRPDADELQVDALVHVHRNHGAWPDRPPPRRIVEPAVSTDVDTTTDLEDRTPMTESARTAIRAALGGRTR